MTNKYNIKFNNNVPKWDDLTFEKLGSNMVFLDLNIFMEVYEDDKVIYSIKLDIKDGMYYCCGSRNFEYDDIKVNKTIIKDYENKELIYNELKDKYNHIFKDTILNIWITGVFKELCNIKMLNLKPLDF